MTTLRWKDWNEVICYRSWDRNQDMRSSEPTPFGEYKLLRRYAWGPRSRTVNVGKWYVERPGARQLGPFDDDVQAKRSAEADWRERVLAAFYGS